MTKAYILVLGLLISMPVMAKENLASYFAFMGFQLEETELDAIKNQLGDAPTHQHGDAADSYTAICYRISNKAITVYFESGEMGGGTTLLSYRVIHENKPEFDCGKAKSGLINNYNIGSLKLGSNINNTVSLLPSGGKTIRNLLFHYSKKIPFTKEEIGKNNLAGDDLKYAFWDQGVTIELFSRDNVLSGFRVTKITSW